MLFFLEDMVTLEMVFGSSEQERMKSRISLSGKSEIPETLPSFTNSSWLMTHLVQENVSKFSLTLCVVFEFSPQERIFSLVWESSASRIVSSYS